MSKNAVRVTCFVIAGIMLATFVAAAISVF